MKNRKVKYKMFLSLFVASMFLLTALSTIATDISTEEVEASELKQFTQPKIDNLIRQRPSDDPTSQQPCAILGNGIYDPEYGILYGNTPEGTYDLWTTLFLPDDCGPGSAKVFLEVYKKTLGEEVIMYETSFEDNFDIYNNWIQIDGDCGVVGGQYDSWDHSDARASDGDYSMKSTMYDIYKGNQDDFLQCTKSFDVSDQAAVNVSFDIYVDGSGGANGFTAYNVYDYLSFEISDHIAAPMDLWFNPDNYGNMLAMEYPVAQNHDDVQRFLSADFFYIPGAYHFFDTFIDPFYGIYTMRDYTPKVVDLGGGWWHVYYNIEVAELEAFGFDTTDMLFRFAWHSDPELQYEGAYVDNFKVISVENTETKVFQTHTQGPVEWDPFPADHEVFVDFPLDWEAVNDMSAPDGKTTWYDFKLWIEAVGGSYWTPYDWPNVIDIPVVVGDFFDVDVVYAEIETSFGGESIIPGPGIMMEGEDMHLTAWVHLYGTVPTTDVPVVATAFKKQWEEVISDDFEGNLMNWETYHFGSYPSMWHKTSRDAYTGNSAFGCFDEDSGYYLNNNEGDFAECTKTLDVRDYLELEMRYYTKYITADAADRWAILISDPATNFVLGNIGSVGFPTFGYQPDWIGPNQPMGKYQDFDLMEGYDYWYNVRGLFRGADGSQSYDMKCGFWIWETDATGFVNAQAEANDDYWSGLYIDDFSINGLVIGEQVWTDTIIVPEMEPCIDYEVQFEWEDVPYCHYLIRVECDPEGECKNYGFEPWEAQILVVSNKESMHPKEVESIDYTGIGEGEWVISTSDYDNYIATQSTVLYEPYMNSILQLCPDNGGDCGCDTGEPCCIDVSQAITDGLPVELDFMAWWDIEGSDMWDLYAGGAYAWDYCVLEIASGCPCDLSTDWKMVTDNGDIPWPDGGTGTPIIFGDPAGLAETGYYFEPDDGWLQMSALLGIPIDILANMDVGDTEFALRFRMVSDSGFNMRGVKLDDITITNVFYEGFPPEYEDFEDTCDDLDNWCLDNYHVGQYWFHKYDRTSVDDDVGTYCNFYDENMDGIKDPTETTIAGLEDGLIWTTEIEDAFAAWLALETCYDLEAVWGLTVDVVPGIDQIDFISAIDHAYIEVDDGTDTWWILDDLVGTSGEVFDMIDPWWTWDGSWWIGGTAPADPYSDPQEIDPNVRSWETKQYDISFLAGKPIQVRFRLVTEDGVPDLCHHWCVRNVHITGKQDHTAPTTAITMTGNMKESGWYNSAVKVKITADDNVAMGEIHYVLDGVEKVVPGNVAEFTVAGNGEHTLVFWGVDAMGNEEQHKTVPPFKIDSGAAPTVAITAPEPGLYLFGNKLMSFSKVFIIGAFTVEATAQDTDSGIYKVAFYLDDELVGEDTEAPFSQYIATRHMGAGTLKVVAEDFAQNTAEDTLDIKYFKLL